MQADRVEILERIAFGMVVQALTDFRESAYTVFNEETDKPQDIAEDILREAIATMGLPEMHERLYGKVDVEKAIYVFAPDPESVALMIDAKAEKGSRSVARLQMSQTSMEVRMTLTDGEEIAAAGGLPKTITTRTGRSLVVVTVIVKFVYREAEGERLLDRIIVACIPNGILQERYNPSPAREGNIWLRGPDAPTLGEDFRVRLNFDALRNIAPWRIHEIVFPKAVPAANHTGNRIAPRTRTR